MMRATLSIRLSVLLAGAAALHGCSEGSSESAPAEDAGEMARPADAVQPVQPQGAEPSPPRTRDAETDGDAPREPSAFARSFPQAIRGTWRETDGPAPTADQCDNTVSQNMGKVLTVREDGYSYFETGGRFISVSDRSDSRIRALFDTTYADEETRDELTFAVDPVARTLTVTSHEPGSGRTTTYKRCPR